jgi:WD40 repeat protein
MSDDGIAGDPQNAADEREERERRLAALRGLAQSGPAPAEPDAAPAASSAASGPGRHSRSGRPLRRQPRVWALVASALAIVIIGAVVLQVFGGIAGRAQTKRAATPGVAIPALDTLHCESDVAWAPDSRRVALIGYQQTCPQFEPQQYNYFPGYLGVYDTQTGKSLAQINIDKPIQQALHLGAPIGATPANIIPQGTTDAQGIQYRSVAWSPNGKQLAITFYVDEISTPNPRHIEGVLLISPDGHAATVLSQTLGPKDDLYANVWDLTTGTRLPAPVAGPSATSATFFTPGLGAPAQGWTWSTDGVLVPQQPLLPVWLQNQPMPPIAPVGNPDGGASFSVWQPGQFSVQYPSDATGQPNISVPGVPLFQTAFVAWSPDGRYLLDAGLSSVVNTPAGMPTPSPQTLVFLKLDHTVALPVRDTAMAAIMKLSTTQPSSPNDRGVTSLAWSPDGKLLAAVTGYRVPQQDRDYATVTISIVSCATGKTLATLTAHAAVNQTGIGDNEYMRWSPDGKRLYYFSDILGSLTTWGPGLLPQG